MRECARLVLTSEHDHLSRWAATKSVASNIGCTPETLRTWINKTEVDSGTKPGVTTDQAQLTKELERENRELKRANEILRKAAAFRLSVARLGNYSCVALLPSIPGYTQTEVMAAFIDHYRDDYGVEPICKLLPIAPSTYHRSKHLEQHPEQRSERAKRDEQLLPEIQRVWEENHRNYGARKVWKQMKREDIAVARCALERLMKQLGLEGVRRGKGCRTTIPDEATHKSLDLVQREFTASHPDQL